MQDVLIIGTGMAATALANSLAGKARVTLMEKSRGFGGRMATRRREGFEFDHGAQFFTARSPAFQQFLARPVERACIAEWQPRLTTLEAGREPYKREWFEPHFVATPSMNSLCKESLKALEGSVTISLGCEIGSLEKIDSGEAPYRWRVFAKQTDGQREVLGEFDWVLSTAPSAQTSTLFANTNFSQLARLHDAVHLPCFSLMLGLATSHKFNFDLATVKASPIALIVANASKPQRGASHSLLVHSDNGWARENFDADRAVIQQQLIDASCSLLGLDAASIVHSDLHGWRFAKTECAADEDFLLDSENQLAACGDWCLGGRIEDAFLSGQRLGLSLAASFGK